MNTRALAEKLTNVERAVQRGEWSAAHNLLFDAQDCVLQIQREAIAMQAESVRRSLSDTLSLASVAAPDEAMQSRSEPVNCQMKR